MSDMPMRRWWARGRVTTDMLQQLVVPLDDVLNLWRPDGVSWSTIERPRM